jgi:hypothetical protein
LLSKGEWVAKVTGVAAIAAGGVIVIQAVRSL